MSIKVLFLINNLHRGGAERNFLNQANHLNRQKFDVYFATILEEKKENSFCPDLKLESGKNICFNFKSLSDLSAWFRFIRFLLKEKFDVIYSTLFFANFLNRLGIFLTFFNKTKSIIREANIIDIKPRKEIVADRILSLFTAGIIAVSQAVAKSIALKEKISAKKIIVIHNGIEAPPQAGEREIFRKEFNISSSDFVFLNVGMFKTEQKGQKYLIEAFDLLKKDYPQRKMKLLLVGDGRMKEELESLTKLKGLAKEVIFAGLRKDMNDIYRASDVFVLSSLWEGCPNVLLEAMINRLPVVATKVGGVEEMAEHLKTGYLVSTKNVPELKQAMAFMLTDNKKRREFGERGFRRALNDFSLAKNIEKLEELFSRAVKK